MDRQCLFILNFQICSFMVEKRYLSGSFPFLIKQKSQKALISLTFWLVRSRGWENRTPTKGFGDPYHTIWPIPYKVYFIYSQNYIHVNIPWELTSCVADWVLYSAGVTSWLRHSVSFASQMFSLYQECFSTSKLAPNPSCSILPLPRLVGQALTRLVTVSSMCCHTSTSALSTSSSSRGFTS